MTNLILQAVAALGLGTASMFLHGWLFVAGVLLPLPLEAWFTSLPGLGVRVLKPALGGGVLLVMLVLSMQYLLVIRVAAAVFVWMRRSALAPSVPAATLD